LSVSMDLNKRLRASSRGVWVWACVGSAPTATAQAKARAVKMAKAMRRFMFITFQDDGRIVLHYVSN